MIGSDDELASTGKRARAGKQRRGNAVLTCLAVAFTPSSQAFATSLSVIPGAPDVPVLALSSLAPPAVPDVPSGMQKEEQTALPVAAQDKITKASTPASADARIQSAAASMTVPDQTVVGSAAVSSSGKSSDLEPGVGGQSASQQGVADRIPVALRSLSGVDSTDPDQLLSLYKDGAGQARSSMDELDLVLNRPQVYTDLRTLETRLDAMKRPVFNVVDQNSTQSDHLDINQLEVSEDFYFESGRDSLRLGAQRTYYDAPGPNDVRQYAVGFTGNSKIDDIAAVAGEFWVNRFSYLGASHSLVTFDTFVTLRPNDVIRIDLDTSRRVLDNITSLELGLTAQSYGGSIDYVPTDRLRLTVRVFGASYSDGNRRRSEEVETVWRVITSPVIEVGLRGTNFQVSRLLNSGYFNPQDYYSGEAEFRVQSELLPKFTVELAGSGGAEDANPGGVKPLVKGSLQAVYKLTNGWSIDGEAAHFTSRNSTSSGFSRTSVSLGLHYRF